MQMRELKQKISLRGITHIINFSLHNSSILILHNIITITFRNFRNKFQGDNTCEDPYHTQTATHLT